jgi:GntR family transcriptional regulator
MISFEMFQMQEGSPIYQQILLFIKRGIIAGTIRDGDELPSRRVLSARLGVNPNTVMRTYEKLTAEGVIYNRRGIGYFVSYDAREKVLEAQKKQFLSEELPMMIRRMKLLGISEESLMQAFRQTHATV